MTSTSSSARCGSPRGSIGVNNRNLKTFETTLATSQRLAPRIPGIASPWERAEFFRPPTSKYLADVGISTFLVGESLMREHDVEAATRALIRRKAERRIGAAE